MKDPTLTLFTAIGDALVAAGLTVTINPRPDTALPFTTMQSQTVVPGDLDTRSSTGQRVFIQTQSWDTTETAAQAALSTVMDTLSRATLTVPGYTLVDIRVDDIPDVIIDDIDDINIEYGASAIWKIELKQS